MDGYSRLKWTSSNQAQKEADEAYVAYLQKRAIRLANQPPPEQPKRKKKKRRKGKGQSLLRVKVKRTKDSAGYQLYLKSDHWKAKKKAYFQRYEKRCVHCGRTERVELHHTTYKRLYGERDDDLQPLCRDCHAAQHPNKPRQENDWVTKQFMAMRF